MKVELKDEHRWLQRIVGDWTFEARMVTGPGEEPQVSRGTESVRSLGGAWVLCEGEGEMPGGGVSKSVMTLGFDTDRGRFVGTFIASMMSHLWIYDGALDGARRALTLDTRGPDFVTPGNLVPYKDVIEIESDDRRVLRSLHLKDGSWTEMMVAEYRRAR